MIYDEYIQYTQTYKKEYGDKTLVLMEVGSFWELYDCNANMGADMKEIGSMLNIQISKKNKNIQDVSPKNPYMAGFPSQALQKYLPVLIDNDYTVVLVSQVTPPPNPQRKVTHIYSKGTVLDNQYQRDSNFVCSCYVEKSCIGLCAFDLSTGVVHLHESFNTSQDSTNHLDELVRLLTFYNPSEVVFFGTLPNNMTFQDLCFYTLVQHKKVYNMFDTYNKRIHTPSYQNFLLNTVYQPSCMLSPIEFLDLEKHPIAILAFAFSIEYVAKHSEVLVKELQLPKLHGPSDYMNISYNSSLQLDVPGLNKLLNRCKTSQGRRLFSYRLYNPSKHVTSLEKTYDSIQTVISNHDQLQTALEYLKNIYDLEKLFRKMSLGKLNPSELQWITSSLQNIVHISRLNLEKDASCIYASERAQVLFDELHHTFDIDKCSKCNIDGINTNLFVEGFNAQVDDLIMQVNTFQKRIESFQNELHPHFKLEQTDKDGFVLSITIKRYKEIENQACVSSFSHTLLPGFNFTFKECHKQVMQSSYYKLSNPAIDAFNESYMSVLTELARISLELFKETCATIVKKYNSDINQHINPFVANMDVLVCNAKNALEFGYCKPAINKDVCTSFLHATSLRHPIIEKIQTHTMFVANDIELSEHVNGLLVYGLNAAGKSTLMKSVGLSIIMAQAGMYVPAESFVFTPFDALFTRIHRGDDMYNGKSTFMIEMSELRNILKRATKNSLVLGDELCSGTESASAVAIVSAGLLRLSNQQTKFIFATHLHDLMNIDRVTSIKTMRVCHLHVEYNQQCDELVYHRKLRDGPGGTHYGIEVCKALDIDREFIELANSIRNEYTNTMVPKVSKYNAKLVYKTCAICSKHAHEVHHIIEQKHANAHGIFDNTKQKLHKNTLSNLVALCHTCHDNVHNNKIKILGYQQTSNGVRLEFETIKNEPATLDPLSQKVITLQQNGLSMKQIQLQLMEDGFQQLSLYKIRKIIQQSSG